MLQYKPLGFFAFGCITGAVFDRFYTNVTHRNRFELVINGEKILGLDLIKQSIENDKL